MTARRAPRPAARPARRAKRPRRRAVGRRPAAPPRGALAEPPHGHIVCRRCGRIHRLDLQPSDNTFLVELAMRGPRGWTVERIAYSLAAICPSCAALAPP